MQPTTTAANHEDSGIDNSDDIDTSEDVQRSNFTSESDSDEWADFCPRKKKERQLGSNIKLEASSEKQTPSSVVAPVKGAKFPRFEIAYETYKKYATFNRFRWVKTTKTKNRGPKKAYYVRRLVCQGYGKKQARKNKKQSAREVGPGMKCGCGVFVEMYVHMQTDHTTVTQACLEHSYPCIPSTAQLRLGRKKSGVEPSSIPVQILKDMSNMFDKQLSTQSIREMLLANKKFPKSIMITAEFVRNMKLYIKQHNILPDMPDTEVDRMVNMDAHSALEYEDVMISSELLNSSAALASS